MLWGGNFLGLSVNLLEGKLKLWLKICYGWLFFMLMGIWFFVKVRLLIFVV